MSPVFEGSYRIYHGSGWWHADSLCEVPERGRATLRFGPRGRYMVVPFVKYAQHHGKWYPDAAIPVDLTEPDQIVHATIRIDAAKVLADRAEDAARDAEQERNR